ncbi:MAG: outer membrane lipoprotein carrier protein LolA [Meiothermus sp.]|nr:outer membrane lipoprotein carrier protein LolA [Meiothermus sp.]
MSFIAKIVLGLALSCSVFAQSTPTANQVLFNLALSQRGVQDYQMRIAGTASIAGQTVQLDLTVSRISELELTRVEFNKPDSLAGNVVISEKAGDKNYLALTNQVVVSRDKGNGSRLNLGQLTDIRGLVGNQNSVKLVSSEEIAGRGRVFVLEVIPPNNSPLAKVRVWVLEQGWQPYRIQTFDVSDGVVSDLTFLEFRTNLGLTPQALQALPADAEVVNR